MCTRTEYQKYIISFLFLLTVLFAGSFHAHAGDGIVRYTAVLIGNTYPGKPTGSQLQAPETDIVKMKSALESLYVPYENNVSILNASRSAVLDAIGSKCSSAAYDDDDLLLFYYSGHGSTGNTEGSQNNGALLCCKNADGSITENLTIADLAAALDHFPGKVFVILDSCGSGASVLPTDYDAVLESKSFLGDVVDAFQEKDEASYAEDLIHTKNEELAKSKFYVIAACMPGKKSYEVNSTYNNTEIHYGLMTYYLLEGIGYSYKQDKRYTVFPADSDMNNRFSLRECFDYVSPKVITKTTTSNPEIIVQEIAIYPFSGDSRCNDTMFSDANIKGAVITLPSSEYIFTGQPCMPEPLVKVHKIQLTKGSDYEIEYSGNTAPGEATLTVKGINGYLGTKSVSFVIKAPQTESETIPQTDPDTETETQKQTDTESETRSQTGSQQGSESSSQTESETGSDYPNETLPEADQQADGAELISDPVSETSPEANLSQTGEIITINRFVKRLKCKVSGRKVQISWKQAKAYLQKNPQILGYQIQIASDKRFKEIMKTKYLRADRTSFTWKGKKNSVCYIRIRYYDEKGYSPWTVSGRIRIG